MNSTQLFKSQSASQVATTGGNQTITISTPSVYSGFHHVISYSYKFNPEKIKTLEDVIELLSVFNLFDLRFSASDLSKIEKLDFIAAKGLITKE